MTQQEATITVAVPLAAVEQQLRAVTDWHRFLVDVVAVQQTAHERYVFRLEDGRSIPVALRFHPREHRFRWRALAGPPYDGSILLADQDGTHTRVTLRLTSRPSGALANLAEMVASSTSRAVVDLHQLDDHLRTGTQP